MFSNYKYGAGFFNLFIYWYFPPFASGEEESNFVGILSVPSFAFCYFAFFLRD